MPMHDGERVTVRGSSGSDYELSRRGDVYACTCPAWKKQTEPHLRRTCKHLRAHLGDPHEDARVGDTRVAAAQARAQKSAQNARDRPAVRASRLAALQAAVDRFPAAAARMRAVYAMPLPRHIAYAAGFYLGLTPEEREEAWSHFGCGLAGVTEWFEPDALERVPVLDERLHFRYRRDPPEFVTVFSGNSDGGHWGLWYDDPNELPRVIAHNYARDDAETSPDLQTLLATLRRNMTRDSMRHGDYPLARNILAWLDEVHVLELAAHRDEKIGPPLPRGNNCTGGMDPVVPGARVPPDWGRHGDSHARLEVYRKDPATTRAMISLARDELAEGHPLRALWLARELHWFDQDDYREDAADLGIRGYEAVDRRQLADILRVHNEHRDLPSVGIYRDPPTHPLIVAAVDRDLAAVERLLGESPAPDIVAQALAAAVDLPLVDRLLAASGPDAPGVRLAQAVESAAELRKYNIDPALHLAVLEHLLARGADPGLAFIKALADRDTALALRFAALLDPARLDPHGCYPLHRAILGGDLEVVRSLLDRGADRLARDAHGKTPHDRAREIWQDKRSESLELLALFPAPVEAAPKTELAVGDLVVHAKFGPGKILERAGTGESTKLTISFSDGPRTLLAKFVRPA